MGIRDSDNLTALGQGVGRIEPGRTRVAGQWAAGLACPLYTSDAADDPPLVELGGRRIIQQKKPARHPTW